MQTCPSCKGEGSIRGLVNRGGNCSWETISCFQCHGSKEVPNIDPEFVRVGKALRADRLKRYASQREEAKRLGIDVTLIGKMELGLVDPDPYYTAWEKAKMAELKRQAP